MFPPIAGSSRGLVLLGGVAMLTYVRASFGAGWTSSRSDVLEVLALFAGIFLLYGVSYGHAASLSRDADRRRSVVKIILLFAVGFRLAFVGVGLPADDPLGGLADDLKGDGPVVTQFVAYDNDIWRYLWDGHVSAAGLSPFNLSPDAAADLPESELLDDPWWLVHERVDHGSYRTVYPPVAQHTFLTLHRVAPASAMAVKLLMMLFDIGSCCVLAGIVSRLNAPPSCLLLYAWNPLAIKELAGSGHVDAMLIFFVLLAVDRLLRGASVTGGAALGLAIASKLTPAPLVILLMRRRGGRQSLIVVTTVLTVVTLVSWPWRFDGPDYFRNLLRFATDWEFNAGIYHLFRWIAGDGAFLLSGAAILLLMVGLWRRDDGTSYRQVENVFYLLAAVVLLSPTVMPWYLLWALPFAALLRRWSFIVLTGLSLLSYLIYIDQTEHAWWLWLEHGVFALMFAREEIGRRIRLQPTGFDV
ncbi:MAG: glycosyltransferase 87 family protein [Acidobacteriota bacterium]|nr:glycosyltransferase 87 family protein [Acidobacteriota bacterium]MDH3785290.1 glycosyltransferase 87 family protein [Acidobacteriota bacterium]